MEREDPMIIKTDIAQTMGSSRRASSITVNYVTMFSKFIAYGTFFNASG